MKKFFFLAVLMLGATLGLKAQTVTFNNTTSDYFIGSLHSTAAGASCGSITPGSFYYDIPNNYNYSTNSVYDQNGNLATIPDIIGISFQIYPGGAIFSCSFCTSMTPAASGVKTVVSGASSVTVVWQFIGPDLTISFL